MLSEKPVTRISGVITLMNRLRRKSSAADHAERPHDRDGRSEHRDQRQRQPAEEQERDRHADQEAEAVVDEPVALDRVADLELHDRRAGQLHAKARARERLLGGFLDAADDRPGALLLDRLAVERDDDQRQRAVVGQELALDDLVLA